MTLSKVLLEIFVFDRFRLERMNSWKGCYRPSSEFWKGFDGDGNEATK